MPVVSASATKNLKQDQAFTQSGRAQMDPTPIYLNPSPPQGKEEKDDDESHYATHKLRYNPNNAGQGTYEKKVKIFGNGTKEDFIKFMLEVKDVIRKKPVGTAATKFNLLSSMLNGKAKIEWNLILDAHGPNRQEADWIACVDELTRRVMGNRATKNFKRYLRYCIHKPIDMTVQELIERIVLFAKEYLPEMPGHPQVLDDDEIIEIIHRSLPRAWKMFMTCSGKDPDNMNLQELQDYLEGVETTDKILAREGKSLLSLVPNNARGSNRAGQSNTDQNSSGWNRRKRGRDGTDRSQPAGSGGSSNQQQQGQKAGGRNDGRMFCSYCNRDNHWRSSCRDEARDAKRQRSESYRQPQWNDNYQRDGRGGPNRGNRNYPASGRPQNSWKSSGGQSNARNESNLMLEDRLVDREREYSRSTAPWERGNMDSDDGYQSSDRESQYVRRRSYR